MSHSPPGPLPFLHRCVVFLLFWLAVCFSPLLILTARTLRGRTIGLTGFCFLFLVCWSFATFLVPLIRQYDCFLYLGYVLLFPLLLSLCALQLPRNKTGLPDGVQLLGHLRNSGSYLKRLFWAEEDWLWTGVLLGTFLDPRISRSRGRELRERVRGVVDDLRHIRANRSCPTPWVHLFDAHWSRDALTTLILPEQTARGAIIFLHGHGGNTIFQASLLREFARQSRYIVLCPSFSYGPWELPQTKAVVAWAATVLHMHFDIPPEQTFLMGLSQGAAGVAVAGAVAPFAGLIFLSPTMIEKDLTEKEFAATWQGREVLVIHGEQDRHVTKTSVDAGISAMTAAGITVLASLHPHADHSLFLLETEEVLAEVGVYCDRQLPKLVNERDVVC